MGSFGASIFLVMAVPNLPFAQPRNVLAGHFLASAMGLACFHFIGEGFYNGNRSRADDCRDAFF